MKSCYNCTHQVFDEPEAGYWDCKLAIEPPDQMEEEAADFFGKVRDPWLGDHDETNMDEFAEQCPYYKDAGLERCPKCHNATVAIDEGSDNEYTCSNCGHTGVLYRNLKELLISRLGEVNPYYWGRCLYKYTPCGPWVAYECFEPHPNGSHFNKCNVYYEDAPGDEDTAARRQLLRTCRTVVVGSIVEGSDVELQPTRFDFPFTEYEFEEGVQRIEEEVDFYWKRDNSQYFTMRKSAWKDADRLWFQWVEFDDKPQGSEDMPIDLSDEYNAQRFWNVFDSCVEGQEKYVREDWWVRREETPDLTY